MKRKSVRNGVLTLLIFSLLFSFYTILSDEIVSDNREKEQLIIQNNLLQKNDSLKTQIDSLILITSLSSAYSSGRDSITQSKINDLNIKLEPFIRLATTNYPNLELDDALEKIRQEIIETKKLATRDVYKSLSTNLKKSLSISLSDYIKTQSSVPLIKFYVQQNNQNRYQVVIDLIEIMENAGMNVSIGAMGLFPQSGPQYGVEIHTNLKYVNFIDQLIGILNNYYAINPGIAVRDSEDWKNEGTFPEGEVHIIVSGVPLFSNDGKVTF